MSLAEQADWPNGPDSDKTFTVKWAAVLRITNRNQIHIEDVLFVSYNHQMLQSSDFVSCVLRNASGQDFHLA